MRLLYVAVGMSCVVAPLCGVGIPSSTSYPPSSSSASHPGQFDGPSGKKSSNRLSWFTDYHQGLAQARATNKPMFLLFTGSDWCRWCMRLEHKILNRPAFKAAVGDQFVFVKIDNPRHRPFPRVIEDRNDLIREQFQIEGYPTVLIVDAEEQVHAELSYVEGGVPKFLEELNSSLLERDPR